MLEKTAASLDHCGLQRVLPSGVASLRTSRRLHTTFWQHGAATSVELSQAWQSLMHGNLARDEHADSDDTRNGANLTASSFLLDFLYPNGAVALMRRWVSASDQPFRKPFSVSPARPYTSSASRRASAEVGATRTATDEGVAKIDAYQDTSSDSHKSADATDSTSQPTASSLPSQHEDDLLSILGRNDVDEADQLWHQYKNLKTVSAPRHTAQVMEFLSSTGRLADSWKVSELFHQVDLMDWDDRIFMNGVFAEVKLQNTQHALELFEKALDNGSISSAALVYVLDLLLDASLRALGTESLLAVWSLYPKLSDRLDLEAVTPQLQLVSAIPGLADMALKLKDTLRSAIPGRNYSIEEDRSFSILQRILVRRAVTTCVGNQVLPLLEITRDPAAFEEFLKGSTGRRQYNLATEVYEIYRTLPSIVPSRVVMYEVFKAYTKLRANFGTKLAGLEQLWADWHAFHKQPSQRAYQRYLAFFAEFGDKSKVHSLWIDYIYLYADANVLISGSDTFAHLLNVHAVLGEEGEVQRIFDDMQNKFRLRPNIYCWNILLNAYARAGNYDKAVETFELLSAKQQPDRYSYGTMMQMAGSRGDLSYTADLYRKARSQGLRADAAILGSLVEAYCQNDMWSEAQDVCMRAAKLGTLATRIWNKLLYYHALRRDLAKVNDLLQIMADSGVPYNNYTYQQLLLALSLCRQADHALHMLTIGLKDKIFEVTTDHFYIVMGAFIRTGEIPQVLRLSKLMEEYGFYKSSKITFRLAEALAQWRRSAHNAQSKRIEERFLAALQAFRHVYYAHTPQSSSNDEMQPPAGPGKASERGLMTAGSDETQFGTLSYLLGQLKDHTASKDLVRLYQLVFAEQEGEKHVLPVALLNSVMAGHLAEGKHDEVGATWTALFKNARKKLRSKDYSDSDDLSRISAKYQYILCTGLKVLLEAMLARKDAIGMQEVVARVLAEGFLLDSKTWNYYVQALVQLHQYQPAFAACEDMLMPGWRGWFRARAREPIPNQLPLDIRRKGSSPRYLRPVTTTIYRLAKGYIELDKMAPWSAPAGKLLEEVEASSPMTMRAIKSILRVHSRLEYEIFEDGNFIADEDNGDDNDALEVDDGE
ncbi:pentatricopeptide repeat-containing protein PET309 [Microdochium nivale]|nr:pentatricopeptide repeat-containing protein PET309 [Microdochium nivale]